MGARTSGTGLHAMLKISWFSIFPFLFGLVWFYECGDKAA
jgi:hypothetical protein